ncbi:MAG: 30S ribosomal protein S12 methylthiotransferase RimO [Pseudomonadota bacterium]
MTGHRAPRVGLISLGCPKALVDSERILTQLRAEGYDTTPRYEDADLVLVNTCGFIDAAIEESLAAIGEALSANGRVIVTGCLGVQAERIHTTHPGVLAVTGPQAYAAVMTAIHQHLPRPHEPFADLIPPQGVRLTPRHYAYLKISEGCHQRCSFCIIPQLRGDLVSRPIGEVLREAEALVNAGVREILVISQDTGAYGVDLRYRPDFWRHQPLRTDLLSLVKALGEWPVWVRLHYLYPYPHLDALLPLMADEVLLPYLDIPLQHASPPILKAMRRPAASERMQERIRAWRQICPNLTIRSTFIVGFPGETEADFETLLGFLDEAQLDRVGCFSYSPVAGASANALPNPVPESEKEIRRAILMARQSTISAARLKRRIGEERVVLVDEVTPVGISARGPGDAPDIDGRVWIEGEWDLTPGDFVKVRITRSDAHDLWAEPSEPETD